MRKLLKFSTRDFIYIIIFLLLIIAALLLKDQLNSSEVVNVISISAGVASIALAFVAIVYSFNQSAESSKQNTLVQEALTKISGKVDEFTAIRDDFADFKTKQFEILEGGINDLRNSTNRSFENLKTDANPEQVNMEKELINSQAKELLMDISNQSTASSNSPLEEKVRTISQNVLLFKDVLTYSDIAGVLSKNNIKFNPATIKNVLVDMENEQLIKKIEKNRLIYIKRTEVTPNDIDDTNYS